MLPNSNHNTASSNSDHSASSQFTNPPTQIPISSTSQSSSFSNLKQPVTLQSEHNVHVASSRKKSDRPSYALPLFEPIGYIHSCFLQKFGCPRQPGLVDSLSTIHLTFGDKHILDGLDEYSHIWLIWYFDLNNNMHNKHKPLKVRPPRLNGQTIGVYASRTPHRPNPIALSLVQVVEVLPTKLEIVVSGADLVDGTPIIDIKPFVPYSDTPQSAVKSPEWLPGKPRTRLVVEFDPSIDIGHWEKKYPRFRSTIEQTIGLDPRPYFHRAENRKSGMNFKSEYYIEMFNHNIKFSCHPPNKVVVMDIAEFMPSGAIKPSGNVSASKSSSLSEPSNQANSVSRTINPLETSNT